MTSGRSPAKRGSHVEGSQRWIGSGRRRVASAAVGRKGERQLSTEEGGLVEGRRAARVRTFVAAGRARRFVPSGEIPLRRSRLQLLRRQSTLRMRARNAARLANWNIKFRLFSFFSSFYSRLQLVGTSVTCSACHIHGDSRTFFFYTIFRQKSTVLHQSFALYLVAEHFDLAKVSIARLHNCFDSFVQKQTQCHKTKNKVCFFFPFFKRRGCAFSLTILGS